RLRIRCEAPEQLVERLAAGMQLPDRLRVRDRRLDLLAVADDACVVEEPREVGVSVVRDLLELEAVERAAEVLALAQDRQPGETRLEGLEDEPLIEPHLVVQGPAPLTVVVVDVFGCAQRPEAARPAVRAWLEVGQLFCCPKIRSRKRKRLMKS